MQRQPSSNVEEIIPAAGFEDDSANHYLLVQLPGFKEENVRLDFEEDSSLRISGEKLVHHGKYVYFDQTYTLPENSDAKNINGEFDGEVLRIIIPKLTGTGEIEPLTDQLDDEERHVGEERKGRKKGGKGEGRGRKEKRDKEPKKEMEEKGEGKNKQEESPKITKIAIEILNANKVAILTAGLAFAVGVLISKQFGSTEKNEC